MADFPSPASCVHCGRSVPSLYRQYSPSVLKETTCTHCGQVADKYIEYDPVIVLIDLVLLNKHAIRHLLHNTAFRIHWKLAVVMVLIEGYVKYEAVLPWPSSERSSAAFTDASVPQLDGERLFYMICVEALLASATLFGVVLFLSWEMRLYAVTPQLLWKAVVLGNLGVFFWVPALIWREPGREWIDATFVNGYVFLSLVHVHAAVCQCGRPLSALLVALAVAAKMGVRELLRGLQLTIPVQ